jgi:hypothetical protein
MTKKKLKTTKSEKENCNVTIRGQFITLWLCITLVGLLGCRPKNVERINREHADTVPKQFEQLTHRIDFSGIDFGFPANPHLSRTRAEDDLDELEWLLENRYSYLKLKGVNYKAALDSIRTSLGDGIKRISFGYQLAKFIALFGDGHSCIASPSVHLRSLCSGFLPFLVEESDGQLVAFKSDRSDFVDPNYPFLQALDGVAIDSWLQAASQFVARGSPQFLRYHSIRNLRYIECLRKELGHNYSRSVRVELASANGSRTKQIELPLAKERPIYGFWPRPEVEIKSQEDIRVESRILPQNIGYLRIIASLEEPEFLDGLVEAMNQFKETDGLIIDIRKGIGGTRAPLRVLFPFFMAQNDLPYVVNVAAYRLGTRNRKEEFEGRYLYRASSPHFSQTEQAIVTQLAVKFRPEWVSPPEAFSQWHYFVISPSKDKRYYYYDKPVVILMDTWNFSAWDIFLGALKGWKNITLMGQPSGGGSGCRQSYRLCNSQIKIRLSSMASFQPNGRLYDGNGIQPDVFIEPIPTDFIGETDSILQAAIQKLQKKDEEK